jgi:hypothetical protein
MCLRGKVNGSSLRSRTSGEIDDARVQRRSRKSAVKGKVKRPRPALRPPQLRRRPSRCVADDVDKSTRSWCCLAERCITQYSLDFETSTTEEFLSCLTWEIEKPVAVSLSD